MPLSAMKCPACGATGDSLQVTGQQSLKMFPGVANVIVVTVKCICGMQFTVTKEKDGKGRLAS